MVIEPWGRNSLRVRSTMMGDIQETDYALLPITKAAGAVVEITQHQGVIINGKIKAVLTEDPWSKTGTIAYYNQENRLLLEEQGWHGALNLYARKFKPILGGDYRLTVSFESQEEEKLFGMGQYQQEVMDLKYCSLELAHRNSQASVPFLLSSRGYGFLWHNPAVGKVTFGKNVTQWESYSTKQLDYWITAGDTPAEIEEAYAEATGKVPMMPEYGLGFWQCKLRYWNQEQVLNVAREYKKEIFL